MTLPNPHILDDLPAYLDGALTPDERDAVEAHLRLCDDCRAALENLQELDRRMRQALLPDRPDIHFEERMVKAFRKRSIPRITIHPMVRRAATGVAAALFLGAFGYFADQAVERGRFPGLADVFRRPAQYAEVDADMPLATAATQPAEFRGDAIGGPSSLKDRESLSKRIQSPQEQAVELRSGLMQKLPGLGLTAEPAGQTAANGLITTTASPAASPQPINGPAAGAGAAGPIDSVTWAARGYGAGGGFGYGRVAGGRTLAAGKPEQLGRDGAEANQKIDMFYKVEAGAAPSPAPEAPAFRPADLARRVTDAPPLVNETQELSGKDKKGGEEVPRRSLVANAPVAQPAPAGAPDAQAFGEVAQKGAEQKLAEAGDQTGKPAAAEPASTPAEPAPPAATPTPPQIAAPSQTPPPPPPDPAANRKIIRQGEMTFEVDSFDSSILTITKIVQEEQGFVATTDSDKLANGKVKGSIVLRVPPEHLDTLVLKLRGVGDLKSQKITAQDITKQYTDLESELRAARAMEERLLAIIKDGKGAVKDLLEAEKQLGVWREKIEQVEGEIRYDNNLVSLSTLTVDLLERDIKSAAFASETEQVKMSLETEKVEDAYNAVKEAIGAAKGRIIQSDLKQYEAGQLGATVSAQIPPDAADGVIARVRQISGRIADFQRTRQQSNREGSAAPIDPSKVKREDVTLTLTIYNLANIAPRRTTSLTLATDNVEQAYNAILDLANKDNDRVVSSNLNRPRPDQASGTISIQTPTDKADAFLAGLSGQGELVRQETSDNPDTQNVTTAKRGFSIQVISLATLAPRRSTSLTLAASDVDTAYRTLLDKINAAGGRVIGSAINRGTIEQTNANISFQVAAAKADALLGDVRQAGEVMHQETNENPDTLNTSASKRGVVVQIASLAGVPARQTEQLQAAAVSVPDAFNGLLDLLRTRNARIVTSQLNQQDAANVTGSIDYELPRPAQLDLENSFGSDQLPGHVDLISRNVNRSQDTDNTVDSKIRCSLTLTNALTMAPRQTTSLGVEVSDVSKAVEDLVAAAGAAGGRTVDRDISQEQNGRIIARVTVDVPLTQADLLADQVGHWGTRRVKSESHNPQVPDGKLARGRIEVTFANTPASLGGEETTWDAIRHGLTVSGIGLRWSLQMIVVGLCFVAPWVLLLWGLWRLARTRRPRNTPPAVAAV